MATLSRSAAGMASLLLLGACAWASHDRRHLLNFLDDQLTPATTTGRWLAAPVALPVGVVAGLADTVLVHPTTQIDDAWGDTVEVLWQRDRQTGFRRVVLTPLTVLATPVVFLSDWAVRSVFDVADRAEKETVDPGTAQPAGEVGDPLEDAR